MSFNIPGGRYAGTSTEFVKAYIDSKVSNLISSSPESLNTLKELAEAIGSDPAFFTTMATANTNLQNQINAIHTDSDAAELALSNRLDTLEADPTTAAAVAAVQLDVDQNEADADAAIALKANTTDVNASLLLKAPLASPSFTGLAEFVRSKVTNPSSNLSDNAFYAIQNSTGNFAIQARTARLGINCFSDRTNPADVLLRIGDSTTNDILEVYSSTGGTKVKNVFDAAGGLKINGTEVTATAAEINAFDGRLDTLEADPTTAAAVAAVQADVDQNEADADAAIALKANIASPTFTGTVGGITKSMVGLGNVDNTADSAKPVSTAQQTAIDAVQADVDQNEADADAAIALKANAADAVLTGTTKTEKVRVDDDGSGYFLNLDRISGTQFDISTGNIPSGGNLNIKNSNANNARVVVYSDEFWVRNLGGNNGNGKAKFDGDVTLGDGLIISGTLTNAADDTAAASAGVAVGQVYRNGSVLMIRVS